MAELRPMSQPVADKALESLREGIPPIGHLREFTVGRSQEIRNLESTLDDGEDDLGSALLVQANYGAGKTHLLQLIREIALDLGYAVSLVTVDSLGGVRFNRMDQVVSAVMRELQVDPHSPKGVASLLDAFSEIDPDALSGWRSRMYGRVTADGRWDLSETLKAPGLWVALRAWVKSSDPEIRDLVTGWLADTASYESNRKLLYQSLVESIPGVRDPRSDRSFYMDGVFVFRQAEYAQSWAVLTDLEFLARLCGRRGLVLLFDEFEDVIQNMNNIKWEQVAFTNLFRLFAGERFLGKSYFAVTPEFAARCRERLYDKQVYEFPTERFESLERYEVTPVGREDFRWLARAIRAAHGYAYEWNADFGLSDSKLDALVDGLYAQSSADQVRHAIVGVVDALDSCLDE